MSELSTVDPTTAWRRILLHREGSMGIKSFNVKNYLFRLSQKRGGGGGGGSNTTVPYHTVHMCLTICLFFSLTASGPLYLHELLEGSHLCLPEVKTLSRVSVGQRGSDNGWKINFL